MGAWGSFWKKHDPDDVFAFETFKMVLVRDRKLGILHHSFQLAIFIYIVVVVIFVEKGFLVTAPAEGFVRLSVASMGGADSSHPYCRTPDQSGSLPLCIFPTEDQLVDGTSSSFFITTHINVSEYTSSCNYTNYLCTPTLVSSDQYFVANLGGLKISLDHTSQASFGGDAPSGTLQTQKSDGSFTACSKCSNDKFNSLAADEISLTDLLTAAQLDLSDDATAYLKGSPGYYPADYRSYGAIILLSVDYNNVENYYDRTKSHISYLYQPRALGDVDDFIIDTQYSAYPSNYTKAVKRGIRVVGIITGNISQFSFQTLLIQLTTSIALIKIATTFVDLLAIYVMPRKVQYRNAMFEKTRDFNPDSPRHKKNQIAPDASGASPNDHHAAQHPPHHAESTSVHIS